MRDISKNMKAIHNKGSKIEKILCKELWKRGLRYRKNPKSIYGHPDIAFIGKKIAVFCDGEFWHGYNWSSTQKSILSNKEFWIKKIERNMARDTEVNEFLQKNGWKVIRFWGKEIMSNPKLCADKIEKIWRSK